MSEVNRVQMPGSIDKLEAALKCADRGLARISAALPNRGSM